MMEPSTKVYGGFRD
ncbi:unnamed protein product [Cuscuta europaea]|uniref:Uncharacterized protein n=1 Tax=Cuscuta europaea TaxID=41803 RepID=A0A9P0YT33_CUSEU|nr:unnamed protein product [Cuscuta europaea]